MCFVLLLVVIELEATTFSTREKKLSEFNHKLERKLANAPLSPLASPPASSETKMVSLLYLHFLCTDFPITMICLIVFSLNGGIVIK